MLPLDDLYENYALARAFLVHWSPDEATLDDMLTRFRISSNAIYPFYRAGKLHFLRFSPQREKAPRRLEAELDYIDALRGQGYPANASVPADDGARVVRVDWDGEAYLGCVFEGVPGARLDRIDLTEREAGAHGAALGRLHRLSAMCPMGVARADAAQSLAWAANVLDAHGAPEHMRRALADTRAAHAALHRTPGTYGGIHFDFELDNIFYDAADNTCHVIDFDDCMEGFFATDVEKALAAYTEEAPPERLPVLRAAFLDGYGTEHRICWDEAHIQTVRRFTDLFGYARILYALTPEMPGEPDWMTGLRLKLKEHLREVEAIFSKNA